MKRNVINYIKNKIKLETRRQNDCINNCSKRVE